MPASTTTTTAAPVHVVLTTPVGPLTVAAQDGAVTAVLFEAHRHPLAPGRIGRQIEDPGAEPVLALAAEELGEYFAGRRTGFTVPLAPRGNPFQQRVWALLREIPYGHTCSYGHLAGRLGNVGLARAVGAANGRNPISIVVPCHRVVGANGKLVGYGGGLPHKEFLLRLESSVAGTPSLF